MPTTRAMILETPGQPLVPRAIHVPDPGPGELLLEVRACGVCRTDLHIADGELREPKLPLVLGHEIVGRVAAVGAGVTDWRIGDRAGVPWLGRTCGACRFCRADRENLCERAQFTGYTRDGGYAELCLADARFCLRLPDRYSDAAAAPLLCAGLIGYRAYRMTGDARRLGLYGFGAAAHVLAQVAIAQDREVFAFTRPGDRAGQAFATRLGCAWAGDSDRPPPAPLDAAILFAPVGALVPRALAAVDAGGTVVCAGIHMSEIPAFDYELLWRERVLRSVANLTRADGMEFMRVAGEREIRVAVAGFEPEAANEALGGVRAGKIEGAAVLCRRGRSGGW